LAEGLKLTGTVTPEAHSEPPDGNTPWACLRWRIELNLVNTTPWALELGTDFFLFEANADLSLFEGVALFRGLGQAPAERLHLMPVSPADSYGLANNFQAHYLSGLYHLRRGNRSLRDNGLDYLEDGRAVVNRTGRPRFSTNAEDPRIGFGSLASQQTRQFKLFLDQGICFADASQRARVQIVLPELVVTGSQPVQRYRLVVHLRQAEKYTNTWQVVEQELLRVEVGELARCIETPSANPITRVCAANWLAEIDPERARETLVRVGQTLREGPLLLTCLQLLSARKGAGLEEHALRLLQDLKIPSAIRTWSALYLGVLRHQSAFAALVKTASDPGDLAAIGAVHALGAYGPAAAGPLLDLLAAAPARKNSPLANLIAENLVFCGARSPSIFTTLWQMVEKDNPVALAALVGSNYPETFANLQKRARTERRQEWKGSLAAALIESGGDKAVPDLLEMLRQDAPPPANELLQQDNLVRAVQGWYSPEALLGLLDLVREGNLRAVQVLTGMPHDAALAALVGIARTGTEPQIFIALDGLSQHWPRENLGVFRDALKHPNKIIVQKAIEELGNSGDAGAVPWLTPFVSNADQDLRGVAERALAKLNSRKSAP